MCFRRTQYSTKSLENGISKTQLHEKLPNVEMDAIKATLDRIESNWRTDMVAANTAAANQYAKRVTVQNLELMNLAIDNYGATGENINNMLEGLENERLPAVIEMMPLDTGQVGEESRGPSRQSPMA